MPFQIIRGDITWMQVDAVVNAANEGLQMGGGVCGAIFRAAGAAKLQQDCDRIGRCATGQAVITPGHALPANYIIHTVGPVWQGGGRGEAELLQSCYRQSLELAARQGCQSIAFPLISSGIFGYPKEEALAIAVAAIRDFLQQSDMLVYLVVFDPDSFSIGAGRFRDIQSYIDDHYAEEHHIRRRTLPAETELLQAEESPPAGLAEALPPPAAPSRERAAKPRKLEDLLGQLDEPFSTMLLRLIDEKGCTDVEVYKRANIDRRLFSKIRGNPGYSPSKATAVAFAIALELTLDQTRDLLARAGYALSHSSKFDVIIEYFIANGVHDVFQINEALFAFDQMLLGA